MREEIPLYQALKERNRLIAKIADIKRKIDSYNSVIEGADRGADVDALMKELMACKEQLVVMKTDIAIGNMGILHKLHALEENKDMIVFMKKLDTRHGAQVDRFSEKLLTYDAVITNSRKDAILDELTAKAARLQDEIDEYNHTTMV